ncbi:MAG: biotin--[acetyl-CoA-carboxylase] ligase [Rhodospirillaceae bacterium]
MTQAWFTSAKPPPEPHLPPGWRAMKFDSLDGTNAALRRIVEIEGDVEEGLLVWARAQTAGRGRLGRVWESPEGNVYASILVKAPEDRARAPQLGFVASVAVFEAILELPRHNAPPPPAAHKWPNDVLVDGAKVCGILPELVTNADGTEWVIVGIGLNLRSTSVQDAMYPVGALTDHKVDTTPEHALTVISRAFSNWLSRWRTEGFAPLRTAWLERGPAIGTQVSVGMPNGTENGAFAGLSEDGALLLDTATGRKTILVGDVLLPEGES